MPTRNRPLKSAPRISARIQPKVWAGEAPRSPRRCAASAISTPPTAEKVWKASDMTATERSEEHTSELQSLMRISYAVFCLKKKNTKATQKTHITSKTHSIRKEKLQSKL